jgi:hypothetical protein
MQRRGHICQDLSRNPFRKKHAGCSLAVSPTESSLRTLHLHPEIHRNHQVRKETVDLPSHVFVEQSPASGDAVNIHRALVGVLPEDALIQRCNVPLHLQLTCSMMQSISLEMYQQVQTISVVLVEPIRCRQRGMETMVLPNMLKPFERSSSRQADECKVVEALSPKKVILNLMHHLRNHH